MMALLLEENEIIGGYQANWTIPWDQLYNLNEMTFHVITKETKSEEERFTLLSNLIQESKPLPLPQLK